MLKHNDFVLDEESLSLRVSECLSVGQRIEFLSILVSQHEDYVEYTSIPSFLESPNICDFVEDFQTFKNIARICNSAFKHYKVNLACYYESRDQGKLSNNFFAYVDLYLRITDEEQFVDEFEKFSANDLNKLRRLNQAIGFTDISLSVGFLTPWYLLIDSEIREKVLIWFETHKLKEDTPYAVFKMTELIKASIEDPKVLEDFESVPLSWREAIEFQL